MVIRTKAVGVRLPLDLIERIERYQNERGVNFTEALTELVEQGLGGDSRTIEVSDAVLDERITRIVEEKLKLLGESTSTNALSNDSSHFESIAEIAKVSGETPESLSFADFHNLLGMTIPAQRTKANGVIASAIAKEKGLGDWAMNSTTRKFTKITEDN